MAWAEPSECLILSEPDCDMAEVLRRSMEAQGARTIDIRATTGAGLDALREACCHRTGVNALAAFHPLEAAALALAIQRPVDRLALFCGGRSLLEGADARLARFVRRNLSLCAADLLCADPLPRDVGTLRRLLPRPASVACVNGAKGGWTECEFSVKNAICDFLWSAGQSKSLAENAEMCIIYK